MVVLNLAGDVMLGRGVNEALAEMTPEEVWGDVLPLLLEGGVRIVNLECAITDHRKPWTRTPKVFHFRADPRAVEVLSAARVDAVSLANNHTLDFEEQGLLDTIAHLRAAGIACAGAGKDLAEASRPAVVEAGGERVALVAFTDNEPPFAAGPDRPGTNYLPVSLEGEVLERVEEAVARARAEGAGIVVFSNHWGPNMVERPPEHFRRFARAVVDRGADVYYGHSAHVFQGVEVYRGRPILYDTGDFVDDYAVDSHLRNDRSFLFRVEVGEEGLLRRLELFPVRLPYARVRRAVGEEAEAIMGRMERLSAEMGTRFERAGDRLLLRGPC
ncbi:capsule biosynthesis protein [Rubrobacter xylanophilus]|uniref:Capsule biosynthesis protein n=1 Tax=Rubrobacter xylanophilus TaxID=49319 RepID=A0A510HMG8_9ACTN|nr:CapA family protein [Rubrobacter xylanophilus]BBL81018.1 capsule biosynthesis protein [Rubrobacter xylanophilus]